MNHGIFVGLLLMTSLVVGTATAEERFTKNGWNYIQLDDPFDDSHRAIVVKLESSENGVVVKCDKQGRDSLYIGFLTNNYIGSSSSRRSDAKIRVDKNQVIESKITPDGRYAYIFDDGVTEKVLREMIAGEEVFFRVITFDYEYADAKVDLRGAKEAITWVNEKCQASML